MLLLSAPVRIGRTHGSEDVPCQREDVHLLGEKPPSLPPSGQSCPYLFSSSFTLDSIRTHKHTHAHTHTHKLLSSSAKKCTTPSPDPPSPSPPSLPPPPSHLAHLAAAHVSHPWLHRHSPRGHRTGSAALKTPHTSSRPTSCRVPPSTTPLIIFTATSASLLAHAPPLLHRYRRNAPSIANSIAYSTPSCAPHTPPADAQNHAAHRPSPLPYPSHLTLAHKLSTALPPPNLTSIHPSPQADHHSLGPQAPNP